MVYTDDASELTAAGAPRRAATRRPTTAEQVEAVVRHLAASAGDPPGWHPPSPSELVNVDCEGPVAARIRDTVSVGAGPPISRTTLQKIEQLGIDQWPPQRSPLARELLGGAADTVERHQVDGVWTAERSRLHDQIVAAHFEGKVATDTRDAYFTSGGGASGKSHALFAGPDGGEVGLEHLAGRDDVIAVDPDRIKVMLPEYKTLRDAGDASAALIVHEESSMLGKRIVDEARARGFSTLLDTTGSSGGFTAKLEAAARAGYDVQVTMFSIPTNEAIARSVARGERSGRYVAIHPLKSAHKGASAQLDVWKDSRAVGRWRVYDNSRAPKLVAEGQGGRTTVCDQELWDQILAKGHE